MRNADLCSVTKGEEHSGVCHERVRTAGASGGWKPAAVPCDFSPPFTVQATHLGGEGGLAKKWILIQYVWGGAYESRVLTSSQVISVLLVHGPHFE